MCSFQCTQIGCFFHLCQSIWRHLQGLGLQQQYTNDVDFALGVRLVLALAFIPLHDLEEAFEVVTENFPQAATALLDYFEDTYLGRPSRRGPRRGALFLPITWNQWDRVNSDLPRTNNAVEGWHSAFQANVGAHHPTLWKFIEVLKREESRQRVTLQQAAAGQQPAKKKRKYDNLNARIQTLVADYANMEYLDYLRGIAHNCYMSP